jgi:hypothetical protein
LSEHLQAYIGKNITIELVNGREFSGVVLSADHKFIRVETSEGIGTIPIQAVYIIWESLKRPLTEETMQQLAEKIRASQTAGSGIESRISCTSFPGFTCSRQYICRPPDICTFSFACPGSYFPAPPSGGGGCPFFACGPFQFRPPCGPFQFGAPCGPFQFGGSQCGAPGGFICPGQQFIGIAPGMVST